MSVRTRTLVYGKDPGLLETRELLFVQAGIPVKAAMDEAEVTALLRMRKLDLLILCHTLSRAECDSIRGVARALGPQVKVLLLESDETIQCTEPEDVVLSVFDGPLPLLDAVRQMAGASNAARLS